MMDNLLLTADILGQVKNDAVDFLVDTMAEDLVKVVLYGSCARGDYTNDSDIDIALLVKCDRLEAQKYNAVLADIATKLAMKYFAVVNFVCLPYNEFISKRGWYKYFHNIEEEGEVLYG